MRVGFCINDKMGTDDVVVRGYDFVRDHTMGWDCWCLPVMEPGNHYVTHFVNGDGKHCRLKLC